MKLISDKIDEIRDGSSGVSSPWYWASLGTAVVAGMFSLIVCVLLLSNYLQGKASEPLDSKELGELKATLLREPGNDSVKDQIRSLDLRLRKEYFRRREFSRRGAYLLMGGVLVSLIGIKSAATYRRKLPMGQAASPPLGGHDEELHSAMLARRFVGIFAIVIGSAALVLAVTSDRSLTGELRKAILASSETSGAVAIESVAYPSEEEIKRNWPRFRGPGGLGVSAYTNIPSSWSGKTGEGILWKTAIPLPGENSPIAWGDRVFLTGADEEKREIYCFDGNSGELLWQRAVENIPFSSPEPPEVSEDTGLAAPTAATDGRRVYAIFANGDLACFDFDGQQVWARNLGPLDNIYGHASSLTMYRNLVLVQLDQASGEDGVSQLMAIEGTSGRTVWRTGRPVANSWASPIVIEDSRLNTQDSRQVITCGNPWVIAYEPATGEELWRVDCLSGDVAPSPVYAAIGGDGYATGLVFAANAYALMAAIRPDGRGDATESNIVWTAEDGLPDICSPLTNGELVFLLETYGLLTCYDAKNGEKVWEEDLVETFKASPSLVGDCVYLMTEDGIMIIIKADREFKEIGRYELGENSRGSPAFLDGRMYIRGEENLYCIANPKE